MNLEQAKAFLQDTKRETLADHTFGDAEVYWMRDGKKVASGYFGRESSVTIGTATFTGSEANELESCGNFGSYTRNDGSISEEKSKPLTVSLGSFFRK